MPALAGLRSRFPKEDLDYVKTLVTTALLLLLLPVALLAFLRAPIDVADDALRNHGLGV
jgi:hypothetical protein